jgi:type I restriction enzyme R subunit
MSKQPEAVLEDQLVVQLQKLGYDLVLLKDENALVTNLKHQLEIHNRQALLKTSNAKFSATEFERVFEYIS